MDANLSFAALREEYRTIRAEVRMFHLLSFFMCLVSYGIYLWALPTAPNPTTVQAWAAFGALLLLGTAVWSLREKLGIMPKIADDIRELTGHETVMRHDAGEHNLPVRVVFDWVAFPVAFGANLVIIACAIF